MEIYAGWSMAVQGDTPIAEYEQLADGFQCAHEES
jgi:hypothetical protein